MGFLGFGKKKAKIAGDSWDVYSYEYGDANRAVIRFDVEAAREEEHKGFPHGRRVILFIEREQVRDDGLPGREALARLASMEDALVSALERDRVVCRFVGSMSYGGMRELVFQVEDSGKFAAAVARWQGTLGGQKVEVREKPGWEFFDTKVAPARSGWQQIGNRSVIEQLLKAGSDAARPHRIEHVFVGPPANLTALADALRAQGFEQTELDGEQVVMARDCALDLAAITAVTDSLLELCSDHDVEYDGWGCAVVR